MQMRESVYGYHQSERRRWLRVPIADEPVVMAKVKGGEYRCSLIDVSANGAKLRFENEPPVNTNITIEHPGIGQVSGDGVWRNSREVGMRFHDSQFPDDREFVHFCP